MSENIQTQRRSVIVDPRMPIVSMILMAISLTASIISLIAYGTVAYLNLIAMLAIFAGMILHKKNLQILTGIGTLLIALTHLFYVIRDMASFLSGYGDLSFYNLFVNLLTAAAFIVTGLHYVLRKGMPGRVVKLILMIILAFFGLISMVVSLIMSIEYGLGGMALLNSIPYLLLNFALMLYTPFRRV